MPRNVEIKAGVRSLSSTLQKVQELSSSPPTTFFQEDTFFNVPQGRLKLRKQEGSEPMLIFYDRPDTDGPKLSDYEICRLAKGTNLTSVLTKALGSKGIVRKKRTLCMIGQTRIHLDEVENLGNFIEFEVVLNDNETTEDGQKIAEELMKKIGIQNQDLISGAYLDSLGRKI